MRMAFLIVAAAAMMVFCGCTLAPNPAYTKVNLSLVPPQTGTSTFITQNVADVQDAVSIVDQIVKRHGGYEKRETLSVQDALAAVDKFVQERGFEGWASPPGTWASLRAFRQSWLMNGSVYVYWYSPKVKGVPPEGKAILVVSSIHGGVHIGPNADMLKLRDEVAKEFVARFGKERIEVAP